MRIVLVGTAYPMRGGIAHYIALLYKNLAQKHKVWVISFRRQYPTLLFPGRSQMERGGPVWPVPSEPILDTLNPFTWVRAAKRIRSIKPDIVVFKYWMPFFAPCYAAVAYLTRKAGIKVVLLCDNITPHEPRSGDKLLNRLLLEHAHGFIVQSEAVKQDLLSYRPDANFRLVPHPVYEIFPDHWDRAAVRQELDLSEDAQVLLFFGYIRPYKGLKYLIEAMPEVLQALPQANLIVAGEFYEPSEPYQRRISELGLKDAVRLVDKYIPNEEVGMFFRAADLVVLPYVSATQSGIVQIAYHYGVPVVATAVGGLPEVIEEGRTGFLVPPEDPQALATAIVRFFQEADRTRFAEHIRKVREQFSWKRMVEAIESLVRG